MAKSIRQKSSGKRTVPRKKPLPASGWLLAAVGVGLVIFLLIWLKPANQNQWTFVPEFGINLPMRYPIHGLDVSHHNAAIDWTLLKKVAHEGIKIDFAYIKATEGATHRDKRFAYNWEKAKKAGIRRGAYHFYNPRVLSEKQARNFISTVRMEKGDLPPVLDLETYGGKPDDIIIRGVRNWLRIIEEHYQVKPVIYINEHFYRKYIAGNFDDYPLWIAGYSRKHINDLANDSHVLFWQHSEKGRIKGIRGFVDFNVYVHDPQDWELYLKKETY